MSLFKKYGPVTISLLTALAVIVTALLLKGSAYENAWFYVFAVGSVLASFAELYARKRTKNR